MNLIITHSSGFFSCSSVALRSIIDFYNKNEIFPSHIDRSEQYGYYKTNSSDLISILFDLSNDTILKYNSKIAITSENREDQFSNYKKLNFNLLEPLIKKYFTPSKKILKLVNDFLIKYNIDLKNTCGVFYRGNDKVTETAISTPEVFIAKAHEKLISNPNIKFLVQTDEKEFLTKFLSAFPNNTIYFSELETLSKQINCVPFTLEMDQRETHGMNFFAAVLILSKCKKLITHSGNGGMWAVLYRGNSKNVDQILFNEWI